MKKLKTLIFILSAAALASPSVICADKIYPERYDLRDYGIISTPADQGSRSSCWAFSFLGSVDTRLSLIPDYAGLSEWYLSYSAFNGAHQFRTDNPDQKAYSGTSQIAASVLTSWRGMASAADIPFYYTEDQIMRYEFTASSVPEYILNDISGLTPWIAKKEKADTDYIKSLLLNKNSVAVTCSLSESEYVFNRKTSALFNNDPSYNCKTDPFYHSVLITGWDDTYSRENFSSTSRPEKDGAWIVKNSYGTEWGNDGFFYISYEDTSLQEAVSCTSAEKNTYSSIYQYDHFGWTTSLPSDYVNFLYPGTQAQSSREAYMANIFQSSGNNDISAVSFYTIEPGADYEITVRTGLKTRTASDTGKNVYKQSGTASASGYHTVSLDKPVEVQQGEYFSVILKISNPDSVFTIPIEACIFTSSFKEDGSAVNISNITSINRKVHTGESFISPDGINWYDICVTSRKNPEELSTIVLYNHVTGTAADYIPLPSYPEDERPVSMTCGNVCLKAFTVPHRKSSLPETIPGDVNSDGTVNISDLIHIIKAVLNSAGTSETDLNQDGHTDSADIIILKRLFFN